MIPKRGPLQTAVTSQEVYKSRPLVSVVKGARGVHVLRVDGATDVAQGRPPLFAGCGLRSVGPSPECRETAYVSVSSMMGGT